MDLREAINEDAIVFTIIIACTFFVDSLQLTSETILTSISISSQETNSTSAFVQTTTFNFFNSSKYYYSLLNMIR